jgi:hypothetical protein
VELGVYLVALAGLLGIGRGLVLLQAVPHGQGQLGRAMTHLAGGILCVNLVPALKVLGASLGPDILGLVEAVLG